jgi:hypothetical protein
VHVRWYLLPTIRGQYRGKGNLPRRHLLSTVGSACGWTRSGEYRPFCNNTLIFSRINPQYILQ